MDWQQDSQEWLADQLQGFWAAGVTYARGDDVATLDRVIRGRTLFRIDDGAGRARIERSDMDFLVRPADLVLGGQEAIPQRGDRITWNGSIYEVLAPGKEPPWRWDGPCQQFYRIHTKRVGSAT